MRAGFLGVAGYKEGIEPVGVYPNSWPRGWAPIDNFTSNLAVASESILVRELVRKPLQFTN